MKMRKLFALIKRNLKEVVRDPLSLVFCAVFPVFMLVLLQSIFKNMQYVPENFKIENYAVGICVFGYTFSMMFTAMLIAGDKNTEFANRIKMAPVSQWTHLCSYLLAMLPVVLAQTVLFFAVSLCFGLPFSANILLAIVYLLPSEWLFLSFGVLIGTLAKNEKQAGPISSILISLSMMFGGVFMPIDNLGSFTEVLNILPFSHSVQIASGVFQGDLTCIYPHILWVLGYIAIVWIAIVFLKSRQR